MRDRKQLGADGEALVATYLENKGYWVIDRNYKKQFGEIDLIAQKDDTIAFIEVKTRRSSYFDLTYLVNQSKQKKIITVAKEDLAKNDITDKVCRFDVAIVELNGSKTDLCYIPNAFIQGE